MLKVGRDVRRFVRSMRGYYPVLSGTLPLPQVTMVKNVRRAQKCAMTECPQIYNPLILKVAKRDLWTYRAKLSNRQGYPETGLPLTAENSAANLFPASGERPYSKISEIAIGGAKMFYQSLLKNVRRGSILYFRHKWRCVWQTLWLESKSAHNSVAFHDANRVCSKAVKNNNRAANPPGYLLSDIKRRSLSSLLDRIPHKKSPATRVWAVELCCCGICYRKWWLVSAFNERSGNSGLTFTKKLAIRAVWDPLELLCFFFWFKVILSQHGISVLMIDNLHQDFIFSHKLTSCCW